MNNPGGGIAMRVLLLLALAWGSAAWSLPPPRSIDELRNAAYARELVVERALERGAGYAAQLVSYRVAGLKQFAYVAVPDAKPPAQGFPVVLANHGFHPDPPRYGITADGRDARPGDYYRSIPESYTAQGFMVVMPDYRGHNVSEGSEYTEGFLASAYYTEDVLALLAGLGSLPNADTRNVFMWGHSMGGEVTLRALLATDAVRGASLWSTVGGDLWEQAYYYSVYESKDEPYDSDARPKDALATLQRDIAALGTDFDWRGREPLFSLPHLRAPMILHHAVGDEGALFEWSRRLARELHLLGKPYTFYRYPGDEHFFGETARRLAVERDAQFFRSLMTEN